MSLRSFYSVENNEFVLPRLDVDFLEMDHVPVNPNGGGGFSTITSSDNTITVTPTNNGANINLTGAGSQWYQYPAIESVNFGDNAVTNAGYIQMGTFTQSGVTPLSIYQASENVPFTGYGLYITDGNPASNSGNIGNIYDSQFNRPTMSDVAGAGSSCNGSDIVNIGNLACSKYLTIGNGITGSSQIHLCYDTGLTSGNNIQLSASSAGLQVQYYNNNVGKTVMAISNAGILTVSNGTQIGRVYDDTIYVPSTNSAVGSISFVNTINQSITANTSTTVKFPTADNDNSMNTTQLTNYCTVTNNSTSVNFTNSSPILIQISGFLYWGAGTSNSTRTVNVINSNGGTDTVVSSGSVFVYEGSTMSQQFSATTVVNSNDTIFVNVIHNDSVIQSIMSPSRFVITRLA